MFNPRGLKVFLVVFLVIGSMLGLQGCAPLIFLAANPVITAAVIAAVPAIITVVSNSKMNKDQLEIKRLEAETARTNAISGAAEKLNQQVVSQRQLELDLIDKQAKTDDPALKAQLSNLQGKVAQDQQVISQTLNTANVEANNLANDKGPLPGMTSGTVSGQTGTGSSVTPLTQDVPVTGSGAVDTNLVAPPATSTAVDTVIVNSPVASSTTGVPTSAAGGMVPPNAQPNTPPVLGTVSASN